MVLEGLPGEDAKEGKYHLTLPCVSFVLGEAVS